MTMMQPKASLFLVAAATTILGFALGQTTIPVEWSFEALYGMTHFIQKAAAGNTIEYSWSGWHNMMIHPIGGCNILDPPVLCFSPK